MNLFAKPQAPVIPASQRLQQQIGAILQSPRRLADGLFQGWAQPFDLLWSTADGITPADRLAAMTARGVNVVELLESSRATVTLLLTVVGDKDPEMKAAIMSRLASMPALVENQDGSVTLA